MGKLSKGLRRAALAVAVLAVLTLIVPQNVSAATSKAKDATYTEKHYKRTTTVKGVTVNVDIVYPYLKIAGDAKITKAANRTIKKALVTPYSKYDDYAVIEKDFGGFIPGVTVTVNGTFIDGNEVGISQVGNVLSIHMIYESYTDSSAYPIFDDYCLNIKLTNGKAMTMAGTFKSVGTLRKKVYKAAEKALTKQFPDLVDFLVNPVFAPEAINELKNGWDLSNCFFTSKGMQLIFDEYDHGLHFVGTLPIEISQKTYSKYLKTDAFSAK